MNKTFKFNPGLPFIHKNYPGNLQINGKFVNNLSGNGAAEKFQYSKLLRWMCSQNPQKKEKKAENFKLPIVNKLPDLSSGKNKIIWLGHASFLIRIDGINILTDPILRDLPFLKRKVPLPFDINALNKIDYILISHGHRDHLDKGTIKQLNQLNPGVQFLVPLQMGRLISNWGGTNIQEAGWFQKFNTGKKQPEIIFLPAHHWHRRGLTDFNQILWGSFLIRTPRLSLYFGGDTGFNKHFQEIQPLIAPPDYIIMPIGAYKPPFMMQAYHTSPEDAVNAFNELEGKTFIPMHYGTYDLSDEPLGEPLEKIKTLNEKGHIQGYLKILDIGAHWKL